MVGKDTDHGGKDGKRTVVDDLVVDKKIGAIKLINETKTGNADLSKGQKRLLLNGESATLVGKNAGKSKGKVIKKSTSKRISRVKREDLE